MSVTDNLVSDYKDVLINIKQFNKDLRDDLDIVHHLSQFKHWYYIPNLHLFGPGKYIGYKNMSSKTYNLDGRKSEVETGKVLREWFHQIEPETTEDFIIREELENILEDFDKRLRNNAVIHIPKGVRFFLMNP